MASLFLLLPLLYTWMEKMLIPPRLTEESDLPEESTGGCVCAGGLWRIAGAVGMGGSV